MVLAPDQYSPSMIGRTNHGVVVRLCSVICRLSWPLTVVVKWSTCQHVPSSVCLHELHTSFSGTCSMHVPVKVINRALLSLILHGTFCTSNDNSRRCDTTYLISDVTIDLLWTESDVKCYLSVRWPVIHSDHYQYSICHLHSWWDVAFHRSDSKVWCKFINIPFKPTVGRA